MMKFLSKLVLLLVASSVSSLLVAADLAGYWKNDDQPAWIEIQFENDTGSGTVRRNDNKPEAIGRILLKVGFMSRTVTWTRATGLPAD